MLVMTRINYAIEYNYRAFVVVVVVVDCLLSYSPWFEIIYLKLYEFKFRMLFFFELLILISKLGLFVWLLSWKYHREMCSFNDRVEYMLEKNESVTSASAL
jgi:hypothetical protein